MWPFFGGFGKKNITNSYFILFLCFYVYMSKCRQFEGLSIGVFILTIPNDTIREYGSTLYVGLARAVSPTNTNFRLTFLLTRLQEALYEDLAV